LIFSLLNKEKVKVEDALGKALLLSEQFFPKGFEGELPLFGQTANKVHVKVKVTVIVEGEKSKQNLVLQDEEPVEFINSQALPEPLRSATGSKRTLTIMPIEVVNMEPEKPFTPRKGEEQTKGGEGARGTVHGALEHSHTRPFVHDFWFKNCPLLRNHDVIDQDNEDVNWSFEPHQTFGFVKCTFKLVDGWEDEKPENQNDGQALVEADAGKEVDSDEEQEDDDDDKLKRSFEFNQELNSYAFIEKSLQTKFKGPASVPSRVRVRIYLVKAVCIFGKAGSFADPYINFQLGRNVSVSMKNMVKPGTNTPDFYYVEERDIQLPYDGRLEISIMDMDDYATVDGLIGGTVIDLEDRWHSSVWKEHNRLQTVPVEQRSLFTAEVPGKNRGSLEMWVEMIESTKASDIKPSDIRRPPEVGIEVRFVIWSAFVVRPFKDEHTDVKISAMLDCKEYGGVQPKTQETDIHYTCTDGKAVFAWRIVFPHIQMPVFACAVQFSLMHSEALMGDSVIGTLNLDLKKYVEKVSRDLIAREVGPTDLQFQPLESTGAEEEEPAGSVNVTLWVMTQMEANTRIQGVGRSEPNDDPQLITPTEGRDWGAYLAGFGFSLPSLGLWKKFIPLFLAGFAFLISMVAFKAIGIL